MGKWIKNTDMHPLTNINGRQWRAKGGEVSGLWHSLSDLERLTADEYQTLEWHFPDVDSAPQGV
jgi:hypothetical protein